MRFFHFFNIQHKLNGISGEIFRFSNIYELHSHDYYEIEFIIKGKGTENIEGTIYDIRPGMLYLLTPTETHDIRPNETITLYKLAFEEQVLTPSFLNSFGSLSLLRPVYLSENETLFISSIFEKINQEILSPSLGYLSSFFIQNYLSIIMLHILHGQNNRELSLEKDFKSILSYIKDNCTSPLLLSDIALEAGYNTTYFSVLFKRKTGDTFSAYLAKKRISIAKKLLTTTDAAITLIAFNCGFTSISQFNKTFIKYTGMNASTYRKKASLLSPPIDN